MRQERWNTAQTRSHCALKNITVFCLQTNFNTVLMREKLKKEQIINELGDKLKKVTLQQEKDKSKFRNNSTSALFPLPDVVIITATTTIIILIIIIMMIIKACFPLQA